MPQIEPFHFNENGLNGGGSATLVCTVTSGDTPLTIVWLKDNKTIEHNHIVQKLDDTTSLLRLSHVTLEDAGNYTCTASNSAGSVSRYSILKVKGSRSQQNTHIQSLHNIYPIFLNF